MKPNKKRAGVPSPLSDACNPEQEQLLGERRRILERLEELDQLQIASYIRPPYLDIVAPRPAAG